MTLASKDKLDYEAAELVAPARLLSRSRRSAWSGGFCA